jgi:hypothetical protein
MAIEGEYRLDTPVWFGDIRITTDLIIVLQ